MDSELRVRHVPQRGSHLVTLLTILFPDLELLLVRRESI